MNWQALVFILLTIVYAYRMVLHIVSRRSAKNPTPANVADVYDAETYTRWKAYMAEKNRLKLFSTTLSFIVSAALLFTGAYAAFAKLFPAGHFMQLLSVVLLETLVDTLTGVGLAWVDTMVIEQKYGFNRTTVKTFVIDQIRDLIIGLLIGCGLAALLMWLYTAMGDWMILLFAGVVFAFTLLISFLYGPVFSRLGNKFVPLEEGELKEKLMALLTKHGYQVKVIEVMDASRRTTKLNAYFTGFGKLKSIVLYDNLINAMSTDEICAVFAHELGHGLNRDVLKQQCLGFVNMLLMAVSVWLCVREPALHQAFGFETLNYGFAFVLVGIVLGLVQPLMGMVTSAYSRHAEYRADRQAVKEGYGPYLAAALKKLAKENFAHLAPSPVLVVLEYSHPPLSQRIAAIDKAMEE